MIRILCQERTESLRQAGRDRRVGVRTVGPAAAAGGGEEECQPCAAAPLLRDEAARRTWVDAELAACCTVGCWPVPCGSRGHSLS